jgi:hypothetical protein
MPRFDYKCEKCEKITTLNLTRAMINFKGVPPSTICEHCTEKFQLNIAHRVWSTFTFHFKNGVDK